MPANRKEPESAPFWFQSSKKFAPMAAICPRVLLKRFGRSGPCPRHGQVSRMLVLNSRVLLHLHAV